MIPAWLETLDFAQKHNIKVMLEHGLLTPHIANDANKLQELAQLIDSVKQHPALESYYLFDEPKQSDLDSVGKMVQFIRERDPNHFCFVNMLPVHAVPGYAVPLKPGEDPSKTYVEFLKEYITKVKPDLLSYDYYNFLKNASGAPEDHGMYFVNLSLIRDVARAAKIPFINIIQACTFDKTWRRPTASELRWQVYTTLAYGGKGISYFLYWGPSRYGGIYQDGKVCHELLEPIVQLNKEMTQMSSTLMSLESEHVFNTEPISGTQSTIPQWSPVQLLSKGKYVLGLFSRERKTNYFMLVNSDYRAGATARFKVSGRNLSVYQPKEDKWTNVAAGADGAYSVNLAAGDGRLFHFE